LSDKQDLNAWTVEGPRHIDRHSVIDQGHYVLRNQQRVLESATPNVPELLPGKTQEAGHMIPTAIFLLVLFVAH
jgi:hypothetical protein